MNDKSNLIVTIGSSMNGNTAGVRVPAPMSPLGSSDSPRGTPTLDG